MTDSAIDIHEPTAAICRAIGLEPRQVAELTWRPFELEATVYKLRDGEKYVDEETNTPAVEVLRFEVNA